MTHFSGLSQSLSSIITNSDLTDNGDEGQEKPIELRGSLIADPPVTKITYFIHAITK